MTTKPKRSKEVPEQIKLDIVMGLIGAHDALAKALNQLHDQLPPEADPNHMALAIPSHYLENLMMVLGDAARLLVHEKVVDEKVVNENLDIFSKEIQQITEVIASDDNFVIQPEHPQLH